MASLTVENYVKTIYQLARAGRGRGGDRPDCRRAGRVARHGHQHAQDARREQPGHLHAVRRRAADARPAGRSRCACCGGTG